ncbi:MAG: polysaccharide biosynthesis/export family protein [Paludibacteraceae bacterium]|nr:polysaccharide biosynthesis/export family protein [Paludibacteraceae bacterium]
MKMKFFSLVLVAAMLVSCYTKKETSLLLENGMPIYQQSAYEPHRIAVNDELLLRVISLNEEVASLFASGSSTTSTRSMQTYRVFPDSTIDIPYVNKVKVVGLTIREAQSKVKDALADFDNSIEVRMAFANKSFTFVGESGRGVFAIDKERFTIYDALAVSGGLKQTSDYKNVHLIRETAAGPQIYTFDIRSKSIIDSEYYYVQPNDIIYVDRKKSSFFKVNSYGSVLGLTSTIITFALTIWNLVAAF